VYEISLEPLDEHNQWIIDKLKTMSDKELVEAGMQFTWRRPMASVGQIGNPNDVAHMELTRRFMALVKANNEASQTLNESMKSLTQIGHQIIVAGIGLAVVVGILTIILH